MCQDDNCCIVCSRGFYSCHWRSSSDRKRKYECCCFSLVIVACLLSLCWLYFCLVTFNDQDEVNWKGFEKLKLWVNWFMVLIILSAVIASYCVLLLLFALFQIALGEPLHLHCIHKIFLILGVIVIVFLIIGVSLQWKTELPTLPLSLQATGPFLQFGAVGALTLVSPFIFQGFHTAKGRCSKPIIAVVFLAVSAAILLCPLYIRSPCLISEEELPEKPKLIGHRGAPMLAPENTLMSFNSSIACGVTTFETDVQLSEDRVPFLMHDHKNSSLLRTTDVKAKFPEKKNGTSADFTWEQLQSLNAGKWFIKDDPFRSASTLTKKQVEEASNQKIPSLVQLLDLAKENNISVLFDLYSPDVENDTEVTVDTILRSGIDPRLVLWLPPTKREYVNETAPGFIQVYANAQDMFDQGGNYLNAKYNRLKMTEISELRSKNITVNLWVVNDRWLFSLLWCAGASSVTTNSCHLLKEVEKPDWFMPLRTYKIIWITVDIVSVVIMVGFYICQRHTRPHYISVE